MRELKSAAVLAGTVIVLPGVSAMAAEPYDAPTLAAGGAFLTRSTDVNSPYWNPANLHDTRGVVYLGSNLGLLLGNNAIGVRDVWDAIQPAQSGPLGDYLKYVGDSWNYRLTVLQLPPAGSPSAPPVAVPFPVQEDFDLFLRGDVGLLGMKLSFGDPRQRSIQKSSRSPSRDSSSRMQRVQGQRALSFRSYARIPGIDLALAAPNLSAAFDSSNQIAFKMASGFAELNQHLQSSPSDLQGFKAKADKINTDLNQAIESFLQASSGPITLALTEGAYLTNAFSQEIPVSDLPFARSLPYLQAASVGYSVKVHTALSAVGINPLEPLVGSSFPGVKTSFPGRLELITRQDMQAAAEGFRAAILSLESGGASTSTANVMDVFLKSSSTELISHAPGPVGVSLDLGASIPLQYGLSFGAMLQNVPTFWPGRKYIYTANQLGASGLEFSQDGDEFENFWFTEPPGVRVGIGWSAGSPLAGISTSLEVSEALDGPLSRNFVGTPGLHVGVASHLAGVIHARLGAQIGGKGSLIAAGTGLNLGIARIDVSAGTDPSLRVAALGLSFNLGL